MASCSNRKFSFVSVKVLCAEPDAHYKSCFESFIMEDSNCKVEWIGTKQIDMIEKYPQKSAKGKFILLINVKRRIPETINYDLKILGIEGRTLSILTERDRNCKMSSEF